MKTYHGKDAVAGGVKAGIAIDGGLHKEGSMLPSGKAPRPVPPRTKHRHGLGAVGKDRAKDAARLFSGG